MLARVHWIKNIPFRLAVMPRPRGGDWLADDIASYRSQGVDLVISLLTDEEVDQLDLFPEGDICQANSVDFHRFPIPDRMVPENPAELRDFLDRIVDSGLTDQGIAIHCRMGIGRSALVAACLLSIVGLHPTETLGLIAKARGLPVPDTQEQREWAAKFAQQNRP